MRCLVINAHSSEKKVKTFHEFVAILRPILMHYDKKAKVIIRKFNAISDFVYAADLCPQPGDEKEGEMDEANRKMALKHFDSLDMIFVDGDEALLPWLPELSDLFGLLRLAYQCGEWEVCFHDYLWCIDASIYQCSRWGAASCCKWDWTASRRYQGN